MASFNISKKSKRTEVHRLGAKLRAGVVGLGILLAGDSAKGIVLLGSADPETNTTAPTGTLANSGWELQGAWGGFLGTPVGPHHFLAASHVGGAVGDLFWFQNNFYVTVKATKDPSSDLQMWEVAGTFPTYAQLYDGATETGLDLMVFGRGGIRGAEVRVNNVLKGWQWAGWDGRMRWGQNKVSSVSNDPNGQPAGDQPHIMIVNFDASGSANEAHLASGDSSGGVFIQQSGLWRLAGINWAVDGPYNSSNSGTGFNAALFDEGGSYQAVDNGWSLVTDTASNKPGSFYATRVKARLTWIQGVLAAAPTPLLLEATDVAGLYAPSLSATVDTTNKTIQFVPTANHYYRLQSSGTITIASSHLEGGALVIQYQ
jgi:hypothetical protein